MPQPNDFSRAVTEYWNGRAEGYSLRTIDELDGERSAAWRERMKLFLELAPGAKTADIGCGPGLLAIECAKLGAFAHGCDLSPEMLVKARANALREGVELAIHECDAAHLPFADGELDTVTSRNVIWNLPDPEAALAEWLRVLKPGGRILYEDGNHYRYLTSELHRAAAAAAPVPFGHQEKYVLGADTRKMEVLAQALPLTNLDRPGWDVQTLLALNCEEICIFEPTSTTIPNPDDPAREVSVVQSFFVSARKAL